MRLVQVGLGPIGLAIARLAASQPGFDLAGAVDPRPELAGRDLGELLCGKATGVLVSGDAGEVLARVRPEVVLHATGSFLSDVEHQLREALACGASVVSTCEELAYPFYRHPALARDLDAFAAGRSAALLGTGVNPGFVMDKLVITLLAACRSARFVRVSRIVDASKRRGPLQRKIGAGLGALEFESLRQAGRIGHIGLAESAHMIADAMGLPAARTLHESLQPVLAVRRTATEFLVVEPGQVAGIGQLAAIETGGRDRVRLELQMSIGAERPADRISIEGSPPIEASIEGGIHGDEATAALAVSCAALVMELKPGLRSMLDVPLRGLVESG